MNLEDMIKLTIPENLTKLTFDENYMVELSKENSNIVEKAIKNDPRYQMKPQNTMQNFFDNNDFSVNAYTKIISEIATGNSTRTSKKVINLLAEYCSKKENRFLDRLENGEVELVDDMTEYIQSKDERREKSLCSKICRYLNAWHFEKCDYTINDAVVRSMLPYYMAYYKVGKSKLTSKKLGEMSYKDFYENFNVLREKTELNNHELDHLIWYAYKNDSVRVALAQALTSKI